MLTSYSAALVSGAAIKKGVTVGRFIVFISLWSLLVYNPVARWSWHWSGWSSRYGTMDFAGGTAVHITSGTTVLAFNIFYAFDTKTKKDWSNTRQKVRENLDKLWAYLSFRDLRDNDPVSQMTRRRDRQRLEDYVYARRSVPDRDTGHPNLSMNGEPIENNSTHRGRDGNTIVPHDEEHTENASDSHQNLAVVEALGRGADVEPGGAYDPRKWTDEPPHNCDYMVLGTALLWIGWLGFNGGSALGANMRAVSACVSTHVAACSGGCTSLLIFWLLKQFSGDSSNENAHHVLSVTHFCDGVVIGLVAITPAAGFVSLVFYLERPLTTDMSSTGPSLEFRHLWYCGSDRCLLSEDDNKTFLIRCASLHICYSCWRWYGWHVSDGMFCRVSTESQISPFVAPRLTKGLMVIQSEDCRARRLLKHS